MPKNSKGREVAEIISAKCMGCQLCVGECPTNAIDMVDGVARINLEKCVGCGKCVDVCPSSAILFEKPRKKAAAPAAAAAPAVAEKKEGTIADYKGVAVFIEVRDGAAAEVSWELV